MNPELHPGAERDLEAAAAYYAAVASPKVAARFVAEFYRVARLLSRNPELGSPDVFGRRTFQMRVFPFSVIYRAADQGLMVLVVKHQRKKPGYGASRR